MRVSTPAAGWTRLLAGAVAHDINNLAYSLSSTPMLTGAGSSDAAESAAFVQGCLEQMQKLGAGLRALASAGDTDAWARLDDACADARADVNPARGQVFREDPIHAGLRVRGTAAAVRTAIASLLEHAAAASPTASTIRLAVRQADVLPAGGSRPPLQASSGGSVVLEIASPGASGRVEIDMAPLEVLLAKTLRDLRGDFSLVLAGAIADALGGAVYVASSSETGLVLALHLVADPPKDDAGQTIDATG